MAEISKKPAEQFKKDYEAWKADEKNGGKQGVPFPLLRDYEGLMGAEIFNSNTIGGVDINDWQRNRNKYEDGKLAYQIRAKVGDKAKGSPMSPINPQIGNITNTSPEISANGKPNVYLDSSNSQSSSKSPVTVNSDDSPELTYPAKYSSLFPKLAEVNTPDQIPMPTPGKGEYAPPTADQEIGNPVNINPQLPQANTDLGLNAQPFNVPNTSLGESPTNQPTQSWAQKLFPNGIVNSNIADLGRLAVGTYGALGPIDTYSKPNNWNAYVKQMAQLSQQGFTPEERSLATSNADRGYASDIYNINNASGGNAGVALGNYGRAAAALYGQKANLAAQDAALHRQNLGAYGGVVGQDAAMDRQIFLDKLNQQQHNKQAGAALMSDSLHSLSQRGLYNKQYGEGSPYKQWMDAQIEESKQRGLNMAASTKRFNQSFEDGVTTPGNITGLAPTTVGQTSDYMPAFPDNTSEMANRLSPQNARYIPLPNSNFGNLIQ